MEPSGSQLSSKLPADRSSSSIVHVCHYCGKSFARRAYLLRHIAAHRSPSLKCAACRRQFGRADSLRRHRCRATITTAAAQLSPPTEPASRRRHGCPRCEKTYTRRATLLQHVARVHRDAAESVVDAHPCALCRRVFVSARSLDNHQLSIHAGESAAPPGRPCARRGRRLASQSSVDRRRCPTNGRGNVEETATSTSRTHDDSRGDNLQISDNRGDGVRHASHVDDDATASRQSAAPPPRPTPRTCRCCGRAFSSAGWLRRHLNTAHAHQPSHSPLTTDLSRTSDPSQISSHSQTSDSSQTNDPSQIGPSQLVVVLQAANVSHHQASSSHDARVLYQTTNVSESTSDPLQSSDPSQTNDRSRVAIVLQAVNGSSQASNAHAASVSYQTTSVSESSTSDPPLPAGGGSEAGRRVCPVCGRSLSSVGNLNKHLLIHSAAREACSLCARRFHARSSLRQHVRHAHAPPGCFAVACPACGRRMRSRNSLYAHVARFHSSRPPPRHECQHCGRAFHQRGNLRKHLLTTHRADTLYQPRSNQFHIAPANPFPSPFPPRALPHPSA